MVEVEFFGDDSKDLKELEGLLEYVRAERPDVVFDDNVEHINVSLLTTLCGPKTKKEQAIDKIKTLIADERYKSYATTFNEADEAHISYTLRRTFPISATGNLQINNNDEPPKYANIVTNKLLAIQVLKDAADVITEMRDVIRIQLGALIR